MEITAVVVARKGSRRVLNKNLRKLGDESLVSHKILQLKKCQTLDRIVIGSNDQDILDQARELDVEFVHRPEEFCDEKSKTPNDMIENMCSLIETDVVVWAHCTNPFIQPDTYDLSVKTYLMKLNEGYDSLLSVVKMKEHLWNSNKTPLNYNPYSPEHVLSKDLEPYYRQTGGIFIQSHRQMMKNRYFFGKTPFLFEMREIESMDINTEEDIHVAQLLIKDIEELINTERKNG